jgi:POT family proton-dependent oligopeptide transporter
MGVWFLAAAVGNYIGGRFAGFYESMTLPSLFGSVAIFGIAAGVLLLVLARPLGRLAHGDR